MRPALASATPDAGDLLEPPPYARPERVDELVKRSTARAPDRFDLPPPEGGAAPEPDPITNIDDDGVQHAKLVLATHSNTDSTLQKTVDRLIDLPVVHTVKSVIRVEGQ